MCTDIDKKIDLLINATDPTKNNTCYNTNIMYAFVILIFFTILSKHIFQYN